MSRRRWTLTSPDGRIALTLDGPATDDSGPLAFSVTHDGVVVVAPSPLGIAWQGGALGEVTVEAAPEPVDGVERYTLVHGKQLEVATPYRRLTLELAGPDGAAGAIDLHATDTGIAFRYRIDLPDGVAATLTRESTGFRLPDGVAWIQPHDEPGRATPAYEAAYADAIPTGTATEAPSWNLPALFAHDDRWLLIAEADLGPEAHGIHLGATLDDGLYRVVPPAEGEAEGVGEVWPTISGTWHSPWRVLILGDSLAPVVESSLITDLARPSMLPDPGWVRPGRVSWSWWSDHDSPQSLDALRRYVDFAAAMGWEHTLVDANWNVHDESDLVDLIAHATSRGVGVFLWYNSGGPNNVVTEQPRDRMFDPAIRRREFARLAEWGVAGVKVDFFHSDKPEGIARMWAILVDAAEHRIMVNFHGCTVPRGWRRTWPHMMTMEGVRGAEQYAFAETYPETAVWHNSILPYTRNAVGPMDYTPVTFSHQRYPHLTTAAHELALAVLYESGLQHYADSSESYRSLPDAALDLLRRIPAVWDETRHVGGHPGRHAVLARRTGGRWYVAGIAGREAVEVTIDPAAYGAAPTLLLATDGQAGLDVAPAAPGDDGLLRITMRAAGGFLLEVE